MNLPKLLLHCFGFLVLSTGITWAGSMTMTTYYPAPTGHYNTLTANNIGIGTTAPPDELDVFTSTGYAAMDVATTNSSYEAEMLLGGLATPNAFANLRFNESATSGTNLNNGPDTFALTTGVGATGGISLVTEAAAPITFATNGSAIADERMIIASNGNVGIGLTTPASIFHIYTGASGGTAYGNFPTFESSTRAAFQLLAPNNQDEYLFFGSPAAGNRAYIGYQNSAFGSGSASDQMVFYTSGTYSFMNGNVGIGTTAPDNALEVYGQAIHIKSATFGTSLILDRVKGGNGVIFETAGGAPSGGTTEWEVGEHEWSTAYDVGGANDSSAVTDDFGIGPMGSPITSGIPFLYIDPFGDVGINGSSGDLLLAGAGIPTIGGVPQTGSIVANGYFYPSDQRLKKDIHPLLNALDKVEELNGVSFTWKKSGQKDIGVIAQNVEKVLPELVATGKDGMKSVKYGNIVGVLIEAIKEQQEEIKALQKEVGELKK